MRYLSEKLLRRAYMRGYKQGQTAIARHVMFVCDDPKWHQVTSGSKL